uniref:Uncharacterized protein n=1 Tax=Arundo donax TaxID=35708 RepID=A0A0A8YZM5_ARUDO
MHWHTVHENKIHRPESLLHLFVSIRYPLDKPCSELFQELASAILCSLTYLAIASAAAAKGPAVTAASSSGCPSSNPYSTVDFITEELGPSDDIEPSHVL